MPQPAYPLGEITARGEELLERDIYPTITEDHTGRFIVVDVESGDYEIADTDVAATLELRNRRPDGAFYGTRFGERTAFRTGLLLDSPEYHAKR
jgi:hypothetical protein